MSLLLTDPETNSDEPRTTDSETPDHAELATLLRNSPIQARSRKRLEDLLDAARLALAIYGRDDMNTAHIAEISGASIGTVYRYFPNRKVILQAIFPQREEALPAEIAELLTDDLLASLDSEVVVGIRERRESALAISGSAIVAPVAVD